MDSVAAAPIIRLASPPFVWLVDSLWLSPCTRYITLRLSRVMLICCVCAAVLYCGVLLSSPAVFLQSELGLLDRVAFSSKYSYNSCLQAINGEPHLTQSSACGREMNTCRCSLRLPAGSALHACLACWHF